ncbi:MAG: ATP-binding protein [Vicinamibacteria bacterium]
MGETRVDLVHLLEDLRDAYVDGIDETILSEAIANSLDSRASRIELDIDVATSSITIRDNGMGMRREELRRYHDLARSSKERGEGIGFAGVGIKLGLLVSSEVWTETARAGGAPIATQWRLASKNRAPWQFREPFGAVSGRGTAVRLFLKNPLSPLLDRGFVVAAVRRHFEALFEPHLYSAFSARYPDGVTFQCNGDVLDQEPRRDAVVVEVRLPRKKKAAGIGLMWRSAVPLSADQQGIAISTFGKVIKRGWDWLGLHPPSPDRTGGLIELPALAESLTLNKGDFVRSGIRGALYLMCRKALQETVTAQLQAWGEDTAANDDAARRKAARPFERDLAGVLEDLSSAYPALASLVEHRPGFGGRKLKTVELRRAEAGLLFDDAVAANPGRADGASEETTEAEASAFPAADPSDAPSLDATPATDPLVPGESEVFTGQTAQQPAFVRKVGRYGLSLSFESRPDDHSMGRLVENTLTVNVAHPAYQRAERTRAEGYHLALVAAMSLAKLTVETQDYDAFMTDFLRVWGGVTVTRGRRP